MKARHIEELVVGLLGIIPLQGCSKATYGNIQTSTQQEAKKEIFLHPKEGSAVKTSDVLPSGLYSFLLSIPLDKIEEFGIDGKKLDNYGKRQNDNGTTLVWSLENFPDGQHTAYVRVGGQVYTRNQILDRTKPIIEYLGNGQFLVSDHISGLSDFHLQRLFERSPPERIDFIYFPKEVGKDHVIVTVEDDTSKLENIVLRVVDKAGNASFARLSDYIK